MAMEVESWVVKVDSKESWDLITSQATSNNIPVLVHFGASWCVPSLAMNSHFENLAADHDTVLFLSLDVDELKEVASKLDVKAMPTFVLMRGGMEVDRMVGANPEELTRRLESYHPSITPVIVAE